MEGEPWEAGGVMLTARLDLSSKLNLSSGEGGEVEGGLALVGTDVLTTGPGVSSAARRLRSRRFRRFLARFTAERDRCLCHERTDGSTKMRAEKLVIKLG